jgi:hypothetical protein
MAKLPDLFVNAVTTFDGKALAKGQKQISAFEKNVKSLAKTFGVAFSAAALAQYGKNAVKAFASQQLEVAQLTTAVRNLGLAFATPEIDRYIDKIEAATGVNRDLLQPAMLKLLQVTGSVTKSQELLNLAMDVSAGTGTDLAKTSEILSQAYVGNFKGLRSLNLGLTQAELASTDFEKVQSRLQVLFAGQAKVAADSYVGSMNKLAIASENASEKIGKSLVGALTALSGGETVDDTISKIDKLSSAIAGLIDVTIGLKAGEYLQQYFGLNAGKIPGGFGNRSLSAGNQDTQKADAKARAKAEADAAKRAKELLALQRKQAIAEKNKIALSKAAAVFDTTRVSLAAALKATYDKETRLRLEALMAIEDENGDLALKKIGELAALQKNADLAKLAGIKEISDATLLSINNQLLAELKAINDSKMAEADKELAREEAFKKYNAAITAAGGLAAKEYYSERVQIQLTEIARLASMSNTTSALNTQIILRESAEITMINRVAAAQKAADDARLKALQEYAAALSKIGSASTILGGDGAKGGSPLVGKTAEQLAQDAALKKFFEEQLAKEAAAKAAADAALKAQLEKVTLETILKAETDAVIELLEATAARADAFTLLTDDATKAVADYLAGDPFKNGSGLIDTEMLAQTSFLAGLTGGAGVAGAASGSRYAAQAAAMYNITINAGMGSDPEAIARAVSDALNQSGYRGTSTNRDTGLYTVA